MRDGRAHLRPPLGAFFYRVHHFRVYLNCAEDGLLGARDGLTGTDEGRLGAYGASLELSMASMELKVAALEVKMAPLELKRVSLELKVPLGPPPVKGRHHPKNGGIVEQLLGRRAAPFKGLSSVTMAVGRARGGEPCACRSVEELGRAKKRPFVRLTCSVRVPPSSVF
ncbi:hypothetical protein NDU88_005636 [Pleurodeles waltl]|uniref:Uncharacterized protein n=1 Tax=Pleurodeles waltl TaxID=8319 RepID=A0AAV7L5F0_PLEWA|nr:hypothetical protein NDU88_005636 [Pleurodeles waltl]